MDKELESSIDCNSSNLKDSDNEQSIVGKFKSIINSTPLSKWFRKRDDEDTVLPPSKKFKPPSDTREINCEFSFDTPARPPVNNDVASSNNKFSCFPEPLAGPSGIKHRKTLSATVTSSVQTSFSTSEIFNGHKDTDSEGESTSGYSSVARINSKEHVNRSQESSKQTSPAQNCATPNNNRSLFPTSNSTMNRTLFTEKTTSPNMNTSLSSRRPSFNVSTFGSPNFMDKTLATKKILNSPFYSGKTVYGGASAYGRRLGRSAHDLQSNLQNSVRIKPVNQPKENRDLVLGKTARRILETLEQYSSPINDAKKIPITPKRQVREGVFSKFIGANPYSLKDSRVASNRELQVPTVPELLKMKQKTRLQDSTESVKQIAKTSKSDLNAETYKLSTTDNEKEKHTSKMRTKIASVRQKSQANEGVSEVNLNPVSLQITTLPKFDLVIPPPAAAVITTVSTTKIIEKPLTTPSSSSFVTTSTLLVNTPSAGKNQNEKTVQIEKQASPAIEYHFPKPIVISENLKTIVAYNNFKFSEPICKKAKVDDRPAKISSSNTMNFKMPENKLPTLVPNKSKNNGEAIAKPAMTLLTTGSVMDVLGKKYDSLSEKFKPAAGSWECSTCMVTNEKDKVRCVACETPKAKPETKTALKPVLDKWICSTCLVPNKKDDKQCVACSEPNPSTKLLPVNNPPKASNAPPASSGGFGTAFKALSDGWECSTCLVRNKNELSVCAACETPKSKPEVMTASVSKPLTGATNSFGAAFAKKIDEWECSTCMVRNKSTHLKCVSCETDKPESNKDAQKDSSNQKSTLKFSFAVDKSAVPNFNFGIPATATVSQPPSTVNASSIFGDQSKSAVTSASSSFNFGIPKTTEPAKLAEASQSNQTTNAVQKPTEKLLDQSKPATEGFTFGIKPPTSTSKQNDPKPTVSSSSDVQLPVFNFSSPKSPTLFNNKSDGLTLKVASTTASPVNMFNFNSKPIAAATPLTPQKDLTSDSTKTDTSVTTSAAANLFSENKPVASIFSFGQQNKTTHKPNLFEPLFTSKPMVNSASKPNESMFRTKSSADNVMQFGTAANVMDSKVIPAFGTVNNKAADTSATVFGADAKTESSTLFGASTKPIDSGTPAFGSLPKLPETSSPFSGNSVKPSETTASVFGNNIQGPEASSLVFSSSINNQGFVNNGFVNPSLPSLFGNVSTPTFGITASPTSSEVKPFSFKGDTSTEKETPKAPVFAFGASNVASGNPQATSFSFTAPNPPASAPSSSGFNFTGFAGTTAPAFGSNTFAANTTAGKNGTFSFGTSSADTQRVGFTFGADTAEKLASPAGYTFTTVLTPTTGGFNFSAAPPQFDATVKPSFKFSDGSITAFTAQPPTEGEAGKPLRKIKKGIRRTQR